MTGSHYSSLTRAWQMSDDEFDNAVELAMSESKCSSCGKIVPLDRVMAAFVVNGFELSCAGCAQAEKRKEQQEENKKRWWQFWKQEVDNDRA